jgi:hypothetical protein
MEDNGSIEEYKGRKNKLRRQATGNGRQESSNLHFSFCQIIVRFVRILSSGRFLSGQWLFKKLLSLY